ncbi:hypothetical protein ACEQPO_29210 [Bacillus sp. SL00103]
MLEIKRKTICGYYLLEWRSYADVDKGLSISNAGQVMSYNNGLVVWYVDQSYE